MGMTIEQQLFSWDEWDTYDEGVYVFTMPTLKVALLKEQGEWGSDSFLPGQVFDHAVVDFQRSYVEFFEGPRDEVGYRYALTLTAVGLPIERDDDGQEVE